MRRGFPYGTSITCKKEGKMRIEDESCAFGRRVLRHKYYRGGKCLVSW